MKRIKIFFAMLAAILPTISLSAQSHGFKLGQWMEIQNSIMRNIERYYVDSLPLDKMYMDGINHMLADLDPYTMYVPEKEQESFQMMIYNTYGGIGAVIYKPTKESNVIINEPYEGSPAAKNNLQCGDEIMAINGESVVGMDAAMASSKMKGKAGTKVTFTVRKVRTGGVVDVVVERERIHLPDVEYYGMLDAKTGYIYQTGFTPGVSDVIRSAILDLKKRGMKRLVLDLRGNGGGVMDEAVKIVSLFVPKGTEVVSSKGSDGEWHYGTQTDPLDVNLPLMVMVNSSSASASEIVAGAIQDLDRGVVAGERSYGKGLVQKILPMDYNGQLKVTVSKYYTPSGRCVQAKDYSHRNEDGSVGSFPDSLAKEFKTVKGRIVKDGGGITPDILVKSTPYSRVTYAVILAGLINTYPLEYVKTHWSIPGLDQFSMTDEDYAAFVDWAETQEFDNRSESKTALDILKKQLQDDGEYEDVQKQIEDIEKYVNMDKRTALERNRAQIQPMLEEEIAVRYNFQAAGVYVHLRTDQQLKSALEQWK